MKNQKINLSRKWRSADFSGIVGQELSLRMLKNSLYADFYFPVYLFAGQRGCGKTTTARVFSAAVNCMRLSEFQKSPHAVSIPCLACDSCIAMQKGDHPDFIEIDAASNTGVDNIRSIIELASLLPVMGRKKIYLIDEAHMLSKAAFNALLKILEEPPATVLFILATTDQEKVIDTVKSRCFKLFFNPIRAKDIVARLEQICVAEHIPYDQEGIMQVARQADGSARDAINLLDQLRFAFGGASKEAVDLFFGGIDDALVVDAMRAIGLGQAEDFLQCWKRARIAGSSAYYVWKRIIVLGRFLIWQHYKIDLNDALLIDSDVVLGRGGDLPLSFLCSLIDCLYAGEQVFTKTAMPENFLEMMLLRLCAQRRALDPALFPLNHEDVVLPNVVARALVEKKVHEFPPVTVAVQEKQDDVSSHISSVALLWKSVLENLVDLQESHLYSLLSQACVEKHPDGMVLIVRVPQQFLLFQEVLLENKEKWHPAVYAVFGSEITIEVLFDQNLVSMQTHRPIMAKKTLVMQLDSMGEHQSVSGKNGGGSVPIQLKVGKNGASRISVHGYAKNQESIASKRASASIIDNSEQWPLVNLVLKYFPGDITIIKEL